MPKIADDFAAIRKRLADQSKTTGIKAARASCDDPVVALVVERFALEAAVEATTTEDELDALVEPAAELIGILDDEIAATVASSVAGIKAQIEVLHQLCEGTFDAYDEHHDDDCIERIKASIFAGIEQLADRSRTGQGAR